MNMLFDMDGTLTEARGAMSYNMAVKLADLTAFGKVGIVTGSGLDYMLEQCQVLDELFTLDRDNLLYMPCNGTQVFKRKFRDSESFTKLFEVSMKSELSSESYRLLISHILYEQNVLINNDLSEFTGTFIQDRGSLINWCPIGRDSEQKARKRFEALDEKTKIREKISRNLRDYVKNNLKDDITVALGGATSIDIYPTGWDKTFALRHFEGECCFVGDKCIGDGNDKTIYEALLPNAWITTDPKHTIEIIENNIKPLLEKNNG